MDIQEIIKYSENKIEADDLAKQVRRRIKETAWEKQNRRGFSETFKPLISQFEKPEDSKKENIFTQNQEMLRNQLALIEGLRANQKAITEGFKQFGRLADMKELPEGENKDEIDPNFDPVRQKKILQYNLEKNFDDEDKQILKSLEYPLPNEIFDADPDKIKEIYEMVYNDAGIIGRKVGALKRKKHKTVEQEIELELYKKQHVTQKKYKDILKFYLNSLQYKVGEGFGGKNTSIYFSPQELLKRFELLGGSLAAGNNGVLTEYIQLAHRLRDLGIVTNKQLNTLLRNYLDIR